MVGHDAVDDLVAFVELLGQLRADGHVSAFHFVVDGLADVMQKTGALGQGHIAAQFGGHDPRQMGNLDGMVQHVLAIAGAVAHAAQQLDQFRMNGMQVGFEHGLFAGFANLLIHFPLGLFHHFLDAGGMDAAVHNELFQGDAGDFPPHRIEGGDDHRFGSVVDDEIHPRGGFQGADVAAFAADDAALHVVVGQGHHGDRGFRHVIGGAFLNGQGHDVPGLFLGLILGLSLDFPNHHGRVVIRVLLHPVHQNGLGLFGGKSGDAFQFGVLLVVQLLSLGLQLLGGGVFFVQRFLACFQVVKFLVQGFFALVDPALLPRNLRAAVTNFLVQFVLQANDLFLGLENGFLPLVLGFMLGVFQQVLNHFVGLPQLFLHDVLAIEITGYQACGQRNQRNSCVDCPHQ